jgi:hypothetical protein
LGEDERPECVGYSEGVHQVVEGVDDGFKGHHIADENKRIKPTFSRKGQGAKGITAER